MDVEQQPNYWHTPRLLDCGHLSTPQLVNGTGWTGYVTERDSGRKLCAKCAQEAATRELLTDNDFIGYLSEDQRSVILWTGEPIMHITYLNKAKHNIGGSIYYVRAIDAHRQEWHGSSPVHNGNYVRLHKDKAYQKSA